MMDKIDRSIARIVQRYGITAAELLAIYDEQQGLCPLCDDPLVFGGVRGAHVDHDHTTGKVRGILCALCNMRLGHAERINLHRAIRYLAKPCRDVGAYSVGLQGKSGRPRAIMTADEAEAKVLADKAKRAAAARVRRAREKLERTKK